MPDRVWRDPSLKWLDPCTKSGVFLYQAAQRLMEGLKSEIPDYKDRLEHIYRNMLYGIAISELTGLIARRTLYQCKDATLKTHSIIKFDNPEGNIRFPEAKCEWKGGKCIHCGASEKNAQVAEGREAHIHPFLHIDLSEIFGQENMQINVIIGNPPYQMQDSGYGKSSSPLYHRFVEKAKAIEPELLTFVIPARWYAGGKGLDGFRRGMLSDPRISLLADYPSSGDVFPGVIIAGGVCSFVRDKHHQGDCLVLPNGEIKRAALRGLAAHEVFVRDSKDVAILEKVKRISKKNGWTSMSSVVRPSNFYGVRAHELPSPVTDEPNSRGAILLVTKGGDKYIPKDAISKNSDTIDYWKVIVSRTNSGIGGRPDRQGLRVVISKPRVIPPGSACTETYLVVDLFMQHEPAGRMLDYVKTKTFRFLTSLCTPTQDTTRRCFEFVPLLPMDQNWTDEILCDLFELDSTEIEHIDSKIKPIS